MAPTRAPHAQMGTSKVAKSSLEGPLAAKSLVVSVAGISLPGAGRSATGAEVGIVGGGSSAIPPDDIGPRPPRPWRSPHDSPGTSSLTNVQMRVKSLPGWAVSARCQTAETERPTEAGAPARSAVSR